MPKSLYMEEMLEVLVRSGHPMASQMIKLCETVADNLASLVAFQLRCRRGAAEFEGGASPSLLVAFSGRDGQAEPEALRGFDIDGLFASSQEVRGLCMHGDTSMRAMFDASPWLCQASDSDLLNIADAGWHGPPVVRVAEWLAESNTSLASTLKSFGMRADRDEVRLVCCIESEDAMAWLQENRPHLFSELREAAE